MSSFPALHLLLTMGDLFAASALIMGLAWLAPFRKTASLRHLAWVAGFGALLLLPLLLAVVPSHFSLAIAAPAAVPAVQTHVVAIPQTADASVIAAPVVAASLPQPEAFYFDAAMLVRTLILVWLVGVFAIVLRGALAFVGLDRLRRNSVGHIFRALPNFAKGYDIRIAPDECGPVTWGFARPIILLPMSADYWPTERVTAVLLHEIAHIRRRDSPTQMLSLMVCALYWPNPFVWIGARAMRREAEIAADDAVIVSGVRPSYYAAELVHLASQFRRPRPALLNVPMAERAALEARVESILAQTQQRAGVTAMDVLKITATGFVAVAALAFACPSLAQDVAPPAPPAMAAPPAPVMQSDLPALPPAPYAPPAPAALSAPAVQANVPALPVLPSVAAAPMRHHGEHVHIDDDRQTVDGRDERHIHFYLDGHQVDLDTDDYGALSPEKRAEFDRAEAEARAHVEAMRPQIEAARAQARAAEETAREQVRAAENEARAQARTAENESRIQTREAEMQAREAERAVRAEKPRIEYAVREAGPQIEKAIEDARAEIAKANIDVRVQKKIDRALQRVEAETRVHETGPVDTIVVNQDDGSDNK
jgi:beta-lactamase regulating signal transducer with metallopeptidase domain